MWSMLTKVNYTLPVQSHNIYMYQIPCSYGKSYIGEMARTLETRMKEHKDACRKGIFERSAVAQHAWKNNHPIK